MLNRTYFGIRLAKVIVTTVYFIFIIFCVLPHDADAATPSQRHIFIDGGADNGKVFHAFIVMSGYLDDKWEIFAIEPNPNVIGQIPRFPNLTIIEKAMWTNDGTIDFYLDMAENRSSAGSLFEKDTSKPKLVTVESMDFSQWIKRNFTLNDYIILNMDIEEAEYAVLEKMLEEKTIQYIDRLFVEFNYDHRKENLIRKRKILKNIKRMDVPVETSSLWDIMMRDLFGVKEWNAEELL